MNKFKIALAAAAIGFIAAPMSANAADATGAATATVVAPIAITKNTDLGYGSIAPTGTAGTVTIAATAAGARSGSNVDLLSTDAGSSGDFSVTGEGTSTFSTTIASPVTLNGPSAATMSSTLTNNAPAALTGGAATINVGGELSVGAAQTAGSYTGAFTVTVAYN